PGQSFAGPTLPGGRGGTHSTPAQLRSGTVIPGPGGVTAGNGVPGSSGGARGRHGGAGGGGHGEAGGSVAPISSGPSERSGLSKPTSQNVPGPALAFALAAVLGAAAL